MDAYNLAIVLAPVFMQGNDTESGRFSMMVAEMERNVRLVEKLIIYSTKIFDTK